MSRALLLAAALGAAAWLANAADRLSRAPGGGQDGSLVPLLALDAVLGCAALAALTAGRRRPLAVACLAVALIPLSAASLGPALVALFWLALRRQPGPIAVVAGVHVLTQGAAQLWPLLPLTTPSTGAVQLASSLGVSLLVLAVPVGAGFYLGARRELIATLQERARTAEREQELIGEAAREAERTRIAREMHDVLAHRISLVALHAGALAYRDDLTRAETASTAATIQANAQLALSELRQVLGVLRAGSGPGEGEADVEDPQPTLAELPALLADAREAGMDVRLDGPGPGAPGLAAMGTTLSRTAFRIVQEGLTNARKHAPGAPVVVRLAGGPGADLEVEVVNDVVPTATDLLGSGGVGLLGLRERATLAGGSLVHGPQPDGTFRVRASLPWSR